MNGFSDDDKSELRSHQPPRVVFAGGGTGGHVCPAIAVAEALRELDPRAEVLFLGTGRGVEKRLLDSAGYPDIAVAPTHLRRSLRHLPMLAFASARGLARAFAAVGRFRPQVCLGLGGYAQVPGLIAARAYGVPFALFEPNAVVGRANRLLSGAAREVFIQWPETTSGLKAPERAVITGTPIGKKALGLGDPELARARLGLPSQLPALLIVGGSQGARPLNDWAESVFAGVRRPPFSIIHLTGDKARTRSLKRTYDRAGVPNVVFTFHDRMGELYSASSVVLGRAGGATLAEVTAAGKPCVAVPYPHAVDDHQRANALALGDGGILCDQRELGIGTYDRIVELLSNPLERFELTEKSRRRGHPDAAMAVAERLLAIARGEPTPTLRPRVERAGSEQLSRGAF